MRVEFLKRWLGHAAFPGFLAILAFLLSAPAWRAPFSGDDLVQAAKLTFGHPIKAKGFFTDAHRFVPATITLFDWFRPGLTRRAMDDGVLPWWTAKSGRQSFWRPLAAATHWVDYQVWPARSLPMHLQNAFWFGAFLLAAWALYRSLDGRPWVPGLAALLLALNQENWQALSWIAARNTLMTAFFVALTIWLHSRGVEAARVRSTVGSWFAFAAALLAGEGGVAAAGYLFSYAVFLDQRPWKTRFFSLVPFAVLLMAWRLIYQRLGFGVAYSGLYIDPAREPLRYIRNLLEWAPILIADVFTSPILGRYARLAPHLKPWAWSLVLATVIVLTGVFLPLLRRAPTVRFWALGLVLTLVPACATTVPDDRITLYAALGFVPLVAGFVAGVADGCAWLPKEQGRRRALHATAVMFVVLHLLQPLPGHVKRLTYLFRRSAPPMTVDQVLSAASQEELVVVNSPDVMYLSYLPYFLIQDGAELPGRMRILSSSLGDTVVRRTGTNMLTLVSQDGPLIPARLRTGDVPRGAPWRHELYKARIISTAFRVESQRFAPDDHTLLPGMTAVVRQINERGHPTEVTFTFERALDDAGYRWVFWDSTRKRYARFPLPPVGGERRISTPLPILCPDGS